MRLLCRSACRACTASACHIPEYDTAQGCRCQHSVLSGKHRAQNLPQMLPLNADFMQACNKVLPCKSDLTQLKRLNPQGTHHLLHNCSHTVIEVQVCNQWWQCLQGLAQLKGLPWQSTALISSDVLVTETRSHALKSVVLKVCSKGYQA